jgi:hypothetical protein
MPYPLREETAMQKKVGVEAINVRSGTTTQANNILATLDLGHLVDDLEDGPPGWAHVRTEVDGNEIEGFSVSELQKTAAWNPPPQPTFRPLESGAREALADAAIAQWIRFDHGTGQENKEPFSSFIGAMWKHFGQSFTGKDQDMPWSAVAISLMVRNAAAKGFEAYGNFPESTGHARYIWSSIRAMASGDRAATFWGVRRDNQKPLVGDIIANWRSDPHSYDQFLAAPQNPEWPSHTDIVVAVGPKLCLAIGGNVRNTVYATRYQLDNSGFLSANQRIANGKLVGEVIALMSNRA